MTVRLATEDDAPELLRLMLQFPNPPYYGEEPSADALWRQFDVPDHVVAYDDVEGTFCIVSADFHNQRLGVTWLLPTAYLGDGRPNPEGKPLPAYQGVIKMATMTMVNERFPDVDFRQWKRETIMSGLHPEHAERLAKQYAQRIAGGVAEKIVTDDQPAGVWALRFPTELVRDTVKDW